MSRCPEPAVDNAWRQGVRGISFPRTGHGALASLLVVYFGPSFNYCESYTACRSWPCRRAGNNFQKNHDLKLDVAVQPDAQYIVQIRHPWPAIVSRFRHRQEIEGLADTPQAWERHFIEQLDYYTRFVAKWILADGIQRLVIPYHRLIGEPLESLAEVVQVFGDKIDATRARQVIETRNIQERRRWADFPYMTRQAVEQAEAVNTLGLPMI